ncbi:ERF family protein [Streptomyces sp. NPDC056500]|uniref:ERF family protein n=1 Tax=Streptomyces sp. NPDC056500 TaxID=3345840 RepID=UPI0036CDCBEE
MTLTAPERPTATEPPSVQYVPAPDGGAANMPRVFGAINAVMRGVAPVAKDQENTQQRYKFRGIDDVMNAMAGPMREHGVFLLPELVEHTAKPRGDKMTHVVIRMRYHIYGPAGDCLIATVPGEASDFADKATNKAQSAALKYLLFTVFMIPVDGRSIDDGDRHHPEPTPEQRAEVAGQQQRRQQRKQGQQQRRQGGQERRSHRAEPGPWESTPAPPPPAGPSRDYLAEATAAPGPDEFAQVRAAAVTDGAPADYLAQLDAIATAKRTAAQQRKAARGAEQGTPTAAETAADDARARAEMYDAAKLAGVSHDEANQLFHAAHGCSALYATAEQLRSQRDDLLAAAEQDDQTTEKPR